MFVLGYSEHDARNEQLMAELASTSFVAVGRKYGVSDNAIRKWVRWYERGREERSDAGDEAA